jgi:D-methionine transport system ATP-binding protein
MCNSAVLVKFNGVSKDFRLKGHCHAVLDGIDLEIRRGEIFGIVGASGAGKSTLIRLINRLETPSQGSVEVDGADLSRLSGRGLAVARQKIGMIFQQFGLLSSKTARQNVLYALELAGSGTPESRRAKVDALLARVGLAVHADKYPAQLSGGQKQRVGIARALANDPTMLLCDEATSALDPESTGEILKLLDELNRGLGLTVVLVTHEMDVVRRACDRVAILDHGRIVEAGEVAQVLFEPRTGAARALGRYLLPHPPHNGCGPPRLRLTYFEELVKSDLLSAATQGLHSSLAILAGQVAELKAKPYADLIVAIDGADRNESIARLKARGVRVAEVTP